VWEPARLKLPEKEQDAAFANWAETTMKGTPQGPIVFSRPMLREGAAVALGFLVLAAVPAPAEEQGGVASDEGLPKDPWDEGGPRYFLALEPILGAGFVQGTVSTGYGKPYFIWGGVEAFAFASPAFASVYGGLRASLLVADLRAGVRRTFGIAHGFLPQASAHSYDDFRSAEPKANYTALEVELSGGLPAPGGFAFWDFEWMGLYGVPKGVDLYEEFIKVAARPPSVAAARAAWVLALGQRGRLRIGPFGDLTATFGRGTIARAGPFVNWQLTHHLDLLGVAAFALRTPDSLGALYGTYGTLFLRWRWASGEEKPHFP
jgi:hypothetical protein